MTPDDVRDYLTRSLEDAIRGMDHGVGLSGEPLGPDRFAYWAGALEATIANAITFLGGHPPALFPPGRKDVTR